MPPDAILRELLARVVEGDDVALAQFVTATQQDVWRLCSTLGSSGEVDDLVQETYLRMMRSARGFRGESPVKSWVFAIARNVCADHVRRRERQRRLVARIAERMPRDDEPAPTEPIGWLDDLSPERREAFVLTQVMNLSYENAAQIAGCPVGTIRSRVHRAREDLLRIVAEQAASG